MKVNGKNYRTIWLNPQNEKVVQIIDQRYLPHKFVIENLRSSDDVIDAIKDMHVRGAGLIGAAAAYGMYLANFGLHEDDDAYPYLEWTGQRLKATRPTAINLAWAVEKQLENVKNFYSHEEQKNISLKVAREIANEDVKNCKKIGEYGVRLIENIFCKKKREVNILTHCNAGWLAFVDYGSALAPIYNAFHKKIPLHVWVDLTSPRNQGTLTAWELEQQEIPCTIIPDNTGGHLMQKGLVDLVLVGADRITRTGDVANKIGTYLKALSAKDNHIPFYVCAPSSTLDWKICDGREIPIEKRNPDEVKYSSGLDKWGRIKKVLLTSKDSDALNYGFDITPSRLITGLITERGICEAQEKNILNLFPEHK